MGKYAFTLSTDSTCDLYYHEYEENDIKHVPLTFNVESKDGVTQDRTDEFRSYEEYVAFYNELRGGAFSRTSMLNYDAHHNHFLKLAEEGAEDVLHFTISSGLSPTKDVAARAAGDVKKRYPKFNVLVVDPLTATVGQGALVLMAAKWRNEGKTAQETYDFVMGLRLHIQHFIVADDLKYLQRGGRVSAAAAVIGTALNIKPIVSFDKEGKLFQLAKVRGPKKAISFIKEKLEREGPDPRYNYVCIVHTDNAPPAEELRDFVRERFGIEPHVYIMGPVIGSHVGPGAFALGYLSVSERNEF